MTLVKFRRPMTSLPNVFDEFFKEWPIKTDEAYNTSPAVNIKEEANRYMIEVNAPGYKRDSLSIGVEEDTLTIKGEIHSDTVNKDERWIAREFRSGSFKRSFSLGGKVKVDSIQAKYEEGILKVKLPKLEQEVKRSKEISIA